MLNALLRDRRKWPPRPPLRPPERRDSDRPPGTTGTGGYRPWMKTWKTRGQHLETRAGNNRMGRKPLDRRHGCSEGVAPSPFANRGLPAQSRREPGGTGELPGQTKYLHLGISFLLFVNFDSQYRRPGLTSRFSHMCHNPDRPTLRPAPGNREPGSRKRTIRTPPVSTFKCATPCHSMSRCVLPPAFRLPHRRWKGISRTPDANHDSCPCLSRFSLSDYSLPPGSVAIDYPGAAISEGRNACE